MCPSSLHVACTQSPSTEAFLTASHAISFSPMRFRIEHVRSLTRCCAGVDSAARRVCSSTKGSIRLPAILTHLLSPLDRACYRSLTPPAFAHLCLIFSTLAFFSVSLNSPIFSLTHTLSFPPPPPLASPLARPSDKFFHGVEAADQTALQPCSRRLESAIFKQFQMINGLLRLIIT